MRAVRATADLGLRRGDRGGGALEYVGVVVVVAVLVAAAVTAFGGAPVASSTVQAIGCYLGTACEPGPGGDQGADPGDATGNDDPDRGDTARDARGDRRDDARGDRDEDEQDPGAPGGESDDPDPGIGDPLPGTTPVYPDPPDWEPVDDGAGEYDSEFAGPVDRATEVAAEAAANAMSGTWPDAARNLLHFLGGSGDPLSQDVDTMLSDLPLVYDNSNWFSALGGWQQSQTGYVTVTPPSTPGGQWTYTSQMSTHLRDQYNWDGTKSTQIGPFDVTDEQLAALHRAGLAQEFTAYGQSSTRRTEGSAP